ncbi:hypothetical protein ID866_6107 [Astraeus odoratus]|nr:hypothetical protein ID866_6107 [Astraeus odoratus]
MGLTARSAPIIAAWIRGNRTSSSQGRCCLQTFKCSGNNLGISGVREIIRAIQEGNWTLTNVEMYANQLAEPLRHLGVEDPSSVSSTASSTSGQLHGVREPVEEWKDCEQGLHTVIMRNVHWKRRTEKEALCLLRYARPVLMPSGPSITIASPQDPSNPPSPPVKDPPFSKELREYILALFAPSLSPAQRIRVYNYASDPATLPPLLPSLRRETRKECLADPSSLGATFGTTKYNPGCQDGKCMGAGNSLICRREMEQSKFLETVGCCSYEPE